MRSLAIVADQLGHRAAAHDSGDGFQASQAPAAPGNGAGLSQGVEPRPQGVQFRE
jgi:hypothetical protein